MLEDLSQIATELGNIRWRISKAKELTEELKKEVEYLAHIETRIFRWDDSTKEQMNEFIGKNESDEQN